MIYFVNQGDEVYWKSKFKSLVQHYEGDLEAEIGLCEEHWGQSKFCFPDRTTL